MFKKALACIMTVCLLLCGTVCFASAEGSANTLKIVNYNVDGLPVPSFMSSTGKNTLNTTLEIADKLNELDADIVGVQEDFDFHTLLSAKMNLNNKTHTLGGMGIGDGLNCFSKYELYNVGRVKWNEAYGVFDAGSDELTPKGILYATIKLAEGAYVDVYDVHADAFDDEGSTKAKRSQYAQLKELVDSHSAGKAVIIMGDFNVYFTMDSGKVLKEIFVKDGGFKEAWVEDENGGNYDYTYSEVYPRYNCPQWGNWDSVEKIFFRDSDVVSFECISHDYVIFQGLSDHAAQVAELSYEIDEAAAAASVTSLKENTFDIGFFIANAATSLYDFFAKVLKALPGLISGETEIGFYK